jgi:hypothetical protein
VNQLIELPGDHEILVGEVVYAESEEKLDTIKPLLHDSGEQFRTIGNEITLQRK